VSEENNIPASSPEIEWDDSEMVSQYANICNVQGTREEISLIFGSNQSLRLDQKEAVKVKVSNRIMLSPAAAKRFARLLQMGIDQYEQKYGAIEI